MALPLDVLPKVVLVPPAKAVLVRARISAPAAVDHDSYLGGFASGNRFVYNDAMQFVWWTPDGLPGLVGYGSGAYGAGPYGEAAPVVAVGYGSAAYGAGPYGEAASGAYGAHNYGRGPFGG